METILTNVKERILHLTDFKKVSKEKFFEDLGVTYGNFKGKAKEKALSSDVLAKIVTKNPDINPEWLLTGKGSMLKNKEYRVPDVGNMVNEPEDAYNPKGIPVLPFDAFAGYGDTSVEGVGFQTIEDRYVIPLFDGLKIDFMLPVRGSSMYPKYNSGDVVACRLVHELLFLQWNKVYVLDTTSQGVIMKRLSKGSTEDHVICKSDNKDYGDFKVPMKDIRSIALVVGVVRLE